MMFAAPVRVCAPPLQANAYVTVAYLRIKHNLGVFFRAAPEPDIFKIVLGETLTFQVLRE
jgi:hypothetical protein